MPRKGQVKGEYVPCHWCGTLVYKTQSQLKKRKNHYCSNKCQSDEKHAATYEDRPCEICGKLIHVSKKSKQKFCSTECQRVWQTQQIGELNTRYSRKKYKCDYCGEEFPIPNHKIDDGRKHFCSKKCRQEWYANIWSQSEEWREFKRKHAVESLKNNPITNLTKPQILINNLLDDNHIGYCNEEAFVYYAVDNYLFDDNLIIEVMGDYWHANPLRFNQLNDMQKRNIGRDKAKHTFLLNHYGINVLYLWESDILNNLDLCLLLINTYIEQNGVLDNYHSFNYTNLDNQLYLKNDIVFPYQDMSLEQINQHMKIVV